MNAPEPTLNETETRWRDFVVTGSGTDTVNSWTRSITLEVEGFVVTADLTWEEWDGYDLRVTSDVPEDVRFFIEDARQFDLFQLDEITAEGVK